MALRGNQKGNVPFYRNHGIRGRGGYKVSFFRASLHKYHTLFFFHNNRLPGFIFARTTLPILQQGLCRHHCLGVFVVSHEECLDLLLFQAGVPCVIRLPDKKAVPKALGEDHAESWV